MSPQIHSCTMNSTLQWPSWLPQQPKCPILFEFGLWLQYIWRSICSSADSERRAQRGAAALTELIVSSLCQKRKEALFATGRLFLIRDRLLPDVPDFQWRSIKHHTLNMTDLHLHYCMTYITEVSILGFIFHVSVLIFMLLIIIFCFSWLLQSSCEGS